MTILLLLVALSFGTWKLANSRTVQLFGDHLDRVATADRVVALTFDDGPDATVEEILDLLAHRRVHATFYLMGQNIAADRAATVKLVAAGHDIGNHTWSHRRMVFVGESTIAHEIESTDRAIRDAGFSAPITFRPPYGKKLVALPRYLAAHDRLTVMWDVGVETFTDEPQSSREIADQTVAQVRPGSIILLHPWGEHRRHVRAAAADVIDRLHADGYRFVTIADLRARRIHR